MIGRRREDGWHAADSEPGDYWRTPDGRWEIRDPAGNVGRLNTGRHGVEEHDDGTITVTPSILDPDGWHGFLVRGVWTVC